MFKEKLRKVFSLVLAVVLCTSILVTPISAIAASNDGWYQDLFGGWHYRVNGEDVTNCWVQDSVGWLYLDSSGDIVKNAIVKDSKHEYYVGDEGYIQIGWSYNEHLGRWYYSDSNGYLVKDKVIKDNGKLYYICVGGYMATSGHWGTDSKNDIHVYAYEDGHLATNAWIKNGTVWRYYGSDGLQYRNKWAKDSKGWLYLDSNGYITENEWVKDSHDWLYVGAQGYPVTNTLKSDSHGELYLDANGYPIRNKWQYTDKYGYAYFGSDGYYKKAPSTTFVVDDFLNKPTYNKSEKQLSVRFNSINFSDDLIYYDFSYEVNGTWKSCGSYSADNSSDREYTINFDLSKKPDSIKVKCVSYYDYSGNKLSSEDYATITLEWNKILGIKTSLKSITITDECGTETFNF